jgi:hypothetical protein
MPPSPPHICVTQESKERNRIKENPTASSTDIIQHYIELTAEIL